MRIKVDLPIGKPLRGGGGGHIANTEGERAWITFKYEWLSTFCFDWGVMGHDNKQCQLKMDRQNTNPLYGTSLGREEQAKGGGGLIE